MKNLLPHRVELLLLCVMALVAGLLAATIGQRDTMLFVMTLPVFFLAALMGFRRSLVAQPVDQKSKSDPNV